MHELSVLEGKSKELNLLKEVIEAIIVLYSSINVKIIVLFRIRNLLMCEWCILRD